MRFWGETRITGKVKPPKDFLGELEGEDPFCERKQLARVSPKKRGGEKQLRGEYQTRW